MGMACAFSASSPRCPEELPAPGVIRLDRSYPVFPLEDLRPVLARQHVIDEIHFAVHARILPALEPIFRWCDEEGVCSRIAVDFFPKINSYVDLEQIGGTPLLTFSGAPADEALLLVKRAIDIVLASVAIVLLSPLFLIVALLIKLTSPGPVIFRQMRCGLNGRTFTFYKFRSMVEDAEARLQEVMHLNEKEIAMKIRNDPRLTPVGKWLRKASIDELPQLFNVLKGDMSLVGPRPAIPTEVERYQHWQRRRLRMRPGLTCLWALRGRDRIDFESWMRLDLQYIDNWSLGLDARIILLTIPQVVLRPGPISDCPRRLLHPGDLLIALLASPPDLSLLADPERWSIIKEHAAGDGVAEIIAYIARPSWSRRRTAPGAIGFWRQAGRDTTGVFGLLKKRLPLSTLPESKRSCSKAPFSRAAITRHRFCESLPSIST